MKSGQNYRQTSRSTRSRFSCLIWLEWQARRPKWTKNIKKRGKWTKCNFAFCNVSKIIFFVRERNNDAVRRSREKARLRQEHTLEAVRNLRKENEELENKKKLLIKELQFYKEMFKKSTGTWLFSTRKNP